MQKRDPQIQLNPKGALSTCWVQTLPHPVGQRRDSEQEMGRSHAAAQGQGRDGKEPSQRPRGLPGGSAI